MKQKILSHTSFIIVLTVLLTFGSACGVMYNKVNSKAIAFIQKMQPRRITVHKIRIAIKRWEESICLDRN